MMPTILLFLACYNARLFFVIRNYFISVGANRDFYPHEILEDTIIKSQGKANASIKTLSILSFLGGGYVGFGYLAYLKVVSGIPPDWAGLAVLLGACVFPICLICILIGGGELATGSMMMMSLGFLTKRVPFKKLARNWVIVSLGNLAGAMAVAYFLGHYVGLAEQGGIATKTIAIAESKIAMSYGKSFVSAIACNWLVCMGIWFYLGAKHNSGRIMGMWFPVMIFVLLGVQHFVANMFIVPAGIWAGANISWTEFAGMMIPVFLGNVVGGSSFVAASYLHAYRHLLKDDYSI